ncbi:NIPSNAP family protein [Salinicola peritrichatus]|uniref:NIPSNAP family protein n=1 Tax=Salinicola peritrichatus TaxID=1267424 RepID=UPI000DA166BF|nr:NIPSNAP family protein [Salinicola peritrichatus]
MIIDHRTYTMVPGRLKAFLELYEREGLPVQRKHLGEPIGYFTVETGPQNQVVHLWGYESAADRERRRTAMESDPDWIAYRRKSAEAGNVQYQENKLLRSVPFSPL